MWRPLLMMMFEKSKKLKDRTRSKFDRQSLVCPLQLRKDQSQCPLTEYSKLGYRILNAFFNLPAYILCVITVHYPANCNVFFS